jgi:hypothetical protein
MLEQWQCAQHRMRTVRRRIYAAHLTVCRGIIEQLEQVEIDAFPTAFVTGGHCPSTPNPFGSSFPRVPHASGLIAFFSIMAEEASMRVCAELK